MSSHRRKPHMFQLYGGADERNGDNVSSRLCSYMYKVITRVTRQYIC